MSRPKPLTPRRLEDRRAAVALSRDSAVRSFRHQRGSPRVCPSCGRVDDLVTRLRIGRQNLYGSLLRFLDYGIAAGTDFDELLAVAEWPVQYLLRRFGRPFPPPALGARATRLTETGTVLRAA